MKLQYIQLTVLGDFCEISTKKEFKFIGQDLNGNVLAKNKKMLYSFSQHKLLEYSKSVYFNGFFVGNICEIKNGFIPEASIEQYYKNKKYKTQKDALNYIISKKFNAFKDIVFGLLAQRQFYYTDNLLKDLSIIEIANIIKKEFPYQTKLFVFNSIVKIVKKYNKANVVNYSGQGGYKLAV